MTCRDPKHPFVVECQMPTGRWQLEQSFWTMEQAKAFAERMTTAFNGIYKFRTRERRPRVVRSHMRMA